ncbi:MAG: hypothetical protein H8E34_12825 [Bacteroidetes bacterium]|nr:hypothetical protein [Bacteroidota bacterium]
MKLSTRFSVWWFNNVSFPLWQCFGSIKSKREIRDALTKRRKEGGCSMWRNYLKDRPEAASRKGTGKYLMQVDLLKYCEIEASSMFDRTMGKIGFEA